MPFEQQYNGKVVKDCIQKHAIPVPSDKINTTSCRFHTLIVLKPEQYLE